MSELIRAGSVSQGRKALAAVLSGCNLIAARYGLSLSAPQMLELAERQAEALKATGRVEFGTGPYPKLIEAFCDSPRLTQEEYPGTLAELCELFYHFKNESGGGWSDDELIERMKRLYDGSCQGSLELMGDRLWQELHTRESGGGDDEEDEEWPDE